MKDLLGPWLQLVNQLEKYQRRLDNIWNKGVPCIGRLSHTNKQIDRVSKLLRKHGYETPLKKG